MQGLRAIRKARMAEARAEMAKYNIDALAAAMGISRPTLTKWERDPSLITRAGAEKAAEYLGCSVDDIFLPTDRN